VQPGQVYLARGPAMLRTILGSCVGVTFWYPKLRIGALCHGVLPRCPQDVEAPDGYRYVDFSIRFLAGQFDSLGARRPDVEVKLFGGADVLPIPDPAPRKPTVGAMNSQTAVEVLELEGFTVVASDLGGIRGRTIHFDTGTGDVFVHRHAILEASTTAAGNGPRATKNGRVRS
jgi:chemotaxis protein CheD